MSHFFKLSYFIFYFYLTNSLQASLRKSEQSETPSSPHLHSYNRCMLTSVHILPSVWMEHLQLFYKPTPFTYVLNFTPCQHFKYFPKWSSLSPPSSISSTNTGSSQTTDKNIIIPIKQRQIVTIKHNRILPSPSTYMHDSKDLLPLICHILLLITPTSSNAIYIPSQKSYFSPGHQ